MPSKFEINMETIEGIFENVRSSRIYQEIDTRYKDALKDMDILDLAGISANNATNRTGFTATTYLMDNFPEAFIKTRVKDSELEEEVFMTPLTLYVNLRNIGAVSALVLGNVSNEIKPRKEDIDESITIAKDSGDNALAEILFNASRYIYDNNQESESRIVDILNEEDCVGKEELP